MTEIKLIEANLSSEWSCPEDEEFWKDRIGMLVEYVMAAEKYFSGAGIGFKEWQEARKALRLEDK